MDTSEGAVVKSKPQRRRWPVGEKRRIVEETLKRGASVARVAQRHAVNANQVFYWRRLYRQGLLGENSAGGMSLLAVTVSDGPVRQAAQAACDRAGGVTSGAIYVELAKGQLRVTGSVDAASLRVVLECLLR